MNMRLAVVLAISTVAVTAGQDTPSLAPARLTRAGAVNDRFQSYNVEMIEVTGGRFWKPYSSTAAGTDLYEYRPPIDLANRRLRALASALGPVYVRVSGTWANSVYFHDSDDPAPKEPPDGFKGVLTRAQWKGVLDFTHAVGGELMTSFAFSAGTRDASGTWTPRQARQLVDYTKAQNGRIAAAEFVNEPNFAGLGGAPEGYDAAAYARDLDVFRRFYREAVPGALLLGPSAVAEGGVLANAQMPGRLATEDLLKATGPAFDAFSFHIYGAVSKRCAGPVPAIGTAPEAARSAEWLARPDAIHAFYAGLRDRYAPGKPLWVTETADAACGGNPWAPTFLDTFRFVNQHARLARQGVQLVAHNTLAASDYGLLDEHTFDPRPNYWAALLWRRLMGNVVLDAGAAPGADLYTYAHCTAGHKGGVTVLAINAGDTARTLTTPVPGERYTLTAPSLQGTAVHLNGQELQAGADGSLPSLAGTRVVAGQVALPPASLTFIAFAGAGNAACQ